MFGCDKAKYESANSLSGLVVTQIHIHIHQIIIKNDAKLINSVIHVCLLTFSHEVLYQETNN